MKIYTLICDPIAIIGHSGKFSKSEDNEEFWNNIINGVELSKEFSRQELLNAGIDASTIDDPNFVNIGSQITDADKFDAELLDILDKKQKQLIHNKEFSFNWYGTP